MCEKCNNIKAAKFVDKTIDTKEYDQLLIIGTKTLISGQETQMHGMTIKTKGNADYKVAQMLSTAFNEFPGMYEMFKMAEELMPIMKKHTH